MNSNQQLEDLESRIAFQEDALEKMSQEMAQQGIEIERLNRIVKLLSDQLKQLAPDNISSPDADVPPPHY